MNQYKYIRKELKDFASSGSNAKKFVGVIHENGIFSKGGKKIIPVDKHKE
jgi:hypothetical protein